MKTIKIYALRDPLTHRVEYIGMTGTTLRERLEQHLQRARTVAGSKATARDRWITSLTKLGLEPVITIVETVTGDWQEREQYWIKYFNVYREDGGILTNATLGGRGVRKGVLRK